MLPAASKLGKKAANCPPIICEEACTPCEHKQYVFDNSTRFNGNPELLIALTESVLDTHEEFLQRLCNFQEDICQRGEFVNFPCIQCGIIDPECITFGEPILNIEACSTCICFTPLDFSSCIVGNVDLSDPEYIEFYQLIIAALEKLNGGFANGCTIESFLRDFLPDASLMFFDNGVYHISLGQVTTEILSILPLLARLVPIPIGATIMFYTSCTELEMPAEGLPITLTNHNPQDGSFSSAPQLNDQGIVIVDIFATFDQPVDLSSLPLEIVYSPPFSNQPATPEMLSGWSQVAGSPENQYFSSVSGGSSLSRDSKVTIDYSSVASAAGIQITGNAIVSWHQLNA